VADGYWMRNLFVEPQSVELEGPRSALEAIERGETQVRTEPVDLEGATDDVVVRAPLVLPEGVRAVNVPDAVTVTVIVEALPVTLSYDAPVQPRRLAAGLEVEVLSPSRVQVLLSGPRSQLEVMSAEDLVAVVDLAGLGPGVHRVTPAVQPPLDLQLAGTTPETVEVVIRGPASTATRPAATRTP
jgi:YbbR domain-containing protein